LLDRFGLNNFKSKLDIIRLMLQVNRVGLTNPKLIVFLTVLVNKNIYISIRLVST